MNIPIHITVNVWNEKYVNRFLDFVLPTQFSEKNLQIFQNLHNRLCEYQIYTFEKDKKRIIYSDIFNKLHNFIKVKVITMDEYVKEDPELFNAHHFRIMTLSNNLAIIDANKKKAAIIVLNADIIFPDGFFSQLIKYLDDGKNLVLLPGIRLKYEKFSQTLTDELKKTNKSNIVTRDFVKIALKHLHPSREIMFWSKSKYISSLPVNLQWKINDDSMLLRPWIIHPILIYLGNDNIPPIPKNETLDFVWWYNSFTNQSKWKIIEDSDELVTFEVCDISQGETLELMKKSIRNMALWANKHIVPLLHSEIINKTKFFVHSSNDEHIKKKLIEQSDKIINKILKKLVTATKWKNCFLILLKLKRKIFKIKHIFKKSI